MTDLELERARAAAATARSLRAPSRWFVFLITAAYALVTSRSGPREFVRAYRAPTATDPEPTR